MDRLSSTAVERSRAARIDLRLSQIDIASRSRTTQSAIVCLESGHSDPRRSMLGRYARAVDAKPVFEAGRMAVPALDRTADEVRASLKAGESGEALRHVIQFLDDIGGADRAAVRQAVCVEPDDTGDERWDALLAGMAEYVGNRVGLPAPGWANVPERLLRKPWSVVEDIIGRPSPGLAMLSFASSPRELANRGVFIDRTSLESV